MTTPKKSKTTTKPKTEKKPKADKTSKAAPAADAVKALRPDLVYVSDRAYFLTNGKLPRGHAKWTFQVDGSTTSRDDLATIEQFDYTGEWGAAKQAAKKHFAGINVNSVELVG
jgi:hypothetical protein